MVEEHKAEEARKNTLAAAYLAANTFGKCAREFFIDYRTKRHTRQRRWRDDAILLGLRYPMGADPAVHRRPELIKGSLADTWRDKPVASIDGHDIHSVVDDARRRTGASRGRKLYAALSVMFGWLMRQRRVTSNPCTGVYRPGPPPARERVLRDSEIVTLWQAATLWAHPLETCFSCCCSPAAG